MKIRKTMIGATLVACVVTACDKTPEETAALTEDGTAPADTAMAADETTPVAAMQRPQTPAERRESRLQLASQQAEKLAGLEDVTTDDSKPNVGEVPAEMMERIIDDLATKIAANKTDIRVLRAESLTWNDGSLGCGKPGQMYTHALVPGYRVILGHNGQQFDYRATEKGYFMLCEKPMLAPPGTGNKPPVQ